MQIVYYTVSNILRWDQLSYLAYGSVSYMSDLLEANKQIGVYNWLPVGCVIACPIILGAAITPLLSSLPDWKKDS